MRTHTFVVLAYKESKFLETCIKSLLNQSVKSDIVIATATPNEHIKKIAEKYNLPLLVNENGGTIGKDWNFALESIDSDLVTLAHQDDVYTKDYLKNILESFNKDTKSAIAFSDYHELRNEKVVPDNLNLKIKKLLLFPLRLSKAFQSSAVNFGCAICCPSVTYNKNELENFRFDENLKSNLDWKAWVELNKNNKQFNYIPKALMLHRIHDESETSNMIAQNKRKDEDLEIFKMIWPKHIAKIIGKLYSNSEKSNNGK